MKKLTVLLFTLFLFFSADAQQILAGIYSGSMYNDSTKMLQKYELALSEYRGKVFGYSYVTFVVNDTFYYGIRRVKGVKNDKNELVLTDEELLANNFPESPAKRVKRTATFPLAQEDTITSLSGTWQTNRTKLYYSVGGATKTERSLDSSQSPLVAHLQELKIISGRPDYQEAVVAKKEPKKEKKNDLAKNDKNKPVTDKPEAGDKSRDVARVDRDKAAATMQDTDANRSDVAKAKEDKKAEQPKGTTDTGLAANTAPAGSTPKTDKPAEGATSGTNGSTVANTTNTNKPEEKKTTTPPNTVAQNPAAINDRTGDIITEKRNPVANNGTETAKNTTANKPADAGNGSVADAKKQVGQPVQNGTTQGVASATDIAKATGTEKKPDAKAPASEKGEPAKVEDAIAKQAGNAAVQADKGTANPGTATNNGTTNNTATTQNKNSATPASAVAAVVPLEQRSTNVIKTLEVVNDSITLSFYDNGVVDGDVISVFVNGQNVIASARLNEVAMKKTIHLPTFAGDSVQVILVAETLGSIPPNTGLLLVHDGDKRYDVRFSADLNTNASIVFRKRKK